MTFRCIKSVWKGKNKRGGIDGVVRLAFDFCSCSASTNLPLICIQIEAHISRNVPDRPSRAPQMCLCLLLGRAVAYIYACGSNNNRKQRQHLCCLTIFFFQKFQKTFRRKKQKKCAPSSSSSFPIASHARTQGPISTAKIKEATPLVRIHVIYFIL